ncbi:MAG: cytochrome P450 [Candidatus Actinomarinales bacterium]|nr:MAG: cytochrome P450 [Candidatus Actinomarinales bacterium]
MELKNIEFPNADLNFIDNPYPALKDFREESPVFYDEKSDLIYLTKYEDVKSIQSSKKYVSAKPANLEGDREWDSRKKAYDYFGRTEEFSLLNLEGSAHNELRGLVAKAFSIRQVELLRPFIENKSREILDPLIGSSFDLIHDYAQPFSIAIMGELLGVPESRYDDFLRWSNDIVRMYDLQVSEENAEIAEKSAEEFYFYTDSLIDEKLKEPGDDMITRLANVTENDQKLSKDQIICTAILLLNAGHEATVNTIGNGISALISNDIETKSLNEEYDVKNIVEELLRWDSPLQFFQRWSLEDTEVRGYKIPKNAKVAILLGSANRDDEIFKNAKEINFQRENLNHTSFGGGMHFCLGAHLARLELEASFNNLFEYSWNLEAKPERTGAFGIRGFKKVMVSA